MKGQEEVICQLEARGILGPELPNTVQEKQEDRRLEGDSRKKRMIKEEMEVEEKKLEGMISPPLCRCRGDS